MVAITDLPPDLLDPSRSAELKAYIQSLPLPSREKRYIFLEWCKRFNYSYTTEEAKEVTK